MESRKGFSMTSRHKGAPGSSDLLVFQSFPFRPHFFTMKINLTQLATPWYGVSMKIKQDLPAGSFCLKRSDFSELLVSTVLTFRV